jgi:hypothetical protein
MRRGKLIGARGRQSNQKVGQASLCDSRGSPFSGHHFEAKLIPLHIRLLVDAGALLPRHVDSQNVFSFIFSQRCALSM